MFCLFVLQCYVFEFAYNFEFFFAQDGKTSAKNSKAKDLAKNALCSTFYTSALKGLSVLCVVSFQKTSEEFFFTSFFSGEDRIYSDSNSEDSASSRQRPAEETVMEVTTPPIV